MSGSSLALTEKNFWGFTEWDSIWPLPHVILAYHAYLYTRSAISVLAYYYLLKVIFLVLLYILGVEFEEYFLELVKPDEGRFFFDQDGRQHQGLSANRQEFDDGCAMIDFNGLFLGGLIQTLLGIILGALHCYLYAGSTHGYGGFRAVTFWEDEAYVETEEFETCDKFLKFNLKTGDFALRYGLWPWRLMFGLQPRPGSVSRERFRKELKVDMPGEHFWLGVVDKGELLDQAPDEDDHMWEIRSIAYRRWSFRRLYWIRWIELLFLGTVSLLLYTFMNPTGTGLHPGDVIFWALNCAFLVVLRSMNMARHLDWIMANGRESTIDFEERWPEEYEDIKDVPKEVISVNWKVKSMMGGLSKRPYELSGGKDDATRLDPVHLDYLDSLWTCQAWCFSPYQDLYSVWIGTISVLVLFQATPILTPFYRVLISSGIIAGFNVISTLAVEIPKRGYKCC